MRLSVSDLFLFVGLSVGGVRALHCLAPVVPRAPGAASAGVAGANHNRRTILGSGFALLIAGVATATGPLPAVAALAPCPAGANNCRSTSGGGALPRLKDWVPPAGMKPEVAWAEVVEVLDAYPQAGQGDVDGGGWKIAEKRDGSYVRAEFTSKRFKFVDDLELELEGGVVHVRSSSRVGDSDFGVNTKRVNYLAKQLEAKGWAV